MRICHVIAAMAFALPLVLIAPAAAMADRDKCLDRNLDAAARIEACAVAIGEAPDADMFVARGRLFEEQEKFEQALDDFSNALDLTADHRKALERRMVVLNKTGDTIAAQADAKRLIELEPDQRWYHYYLGEILSNMGDDAAALAAYDASVAIDADYYWAHVGRGQVFKRMNRLDAAAQAFHRATFARPFAGYARRQAEDAFDKLGETGLSAHHRQFQYTLNPNRLSLRDWLQEYIWSNFQQPELAAMPWSPPTQGMEYLTIRSKVDQREDVQKSVEDLIVFFGGEVYPKADKAVVERYVYGEARGDYIALDRKVRHARERRPRRQPRLPATYRGLFPAEIMPFEPPAPAVRAIYDSEGPNVIWPLRDGAEASGTGRFMIDCTDASGFSAMMMGCLPGRDLVQLGELTWRAKVSVETTHVPMGVFSTYTLYFSQQGSVTILGKTNEFPMEVKFWIDPTLGTWVRRHVYLGDDFILSQALRPESEW